MIALRNPDEIRAIRKAGKIVAAALEQVRSAVRPGVTTIGLDAIARKEILKRGGYPAFKGYRGFPGNICTSVNEAVVHGIPSDRPLGEGDIISVDIGVRMRDYYADGAATFPVGKIRDAARRLIDTTSEALDLAIQAARSGNRLGDMSAAVQAHAEAKGFGVVRSFVGHGIGTKIHEEPEIPNYGRPGTGPELKAGMILAIEPMINAGTYEVEVLDDGWTAVTKDRKLSAHFEHTIAVTDGRAEILTRS